MHTTFQSIHKKDLQSSPTGPAEQPAGGSRLRSCNSCGRIKHKNERRTKRDQRNYEIMNIYNTGMRTGP